MLVLDPERVRTRAHDLVATSEEFLHASWAAAAVGRHRARSTSAPRRTARWPTSARTALAQRKAWWSISPFGLDDARRAALGPAAARRRRRPRVESRTVAIRPAESYHGDVERAVVDIRAWLAAGGRVAAVYEGHGPAQRMVEVLREHDVAARFAEDLASRRRRARRASPSSPADASRTASSTRRSGSRSSPATTSSASGPRPRTCAGCRPGASSRSTRWSSRPATTSCTSSTASAATSR